MVLNIQNLKKNSTYVDTQPVGGNKEVEIWRQEDGSQRTVFNRKFYDTNTDRMDAILNVVPESMGTGSFGKDASVAVIIAGPQLDHSLKNSAAYYWGYEATWVPIWRNSMKAADGKWASAILIGAPLDYLELPGLTTVLKGSGRLLLSARNSWVSRIGPQGAISRGAELRARYGEVFGEYMHFRNQGFTPAQARYLTQPYQGMGHHFPIPQRTARSWGLPEWLRDSQFNVLSPNGISRGRFYELHYMVDPHFHGAAFPRSIGGSWRGGQLGLERYGPWTSWWHATPGPTKAVGGVVIVSGGAAGGYWLFGGSDEE